MNHSLHFFALPTAYVQNIPPAASAARAFIRAQGEKVGQMEFPPGASTLFFVAAEDLTGQELQNLLSGAVGEAEPSDEEVFGGLDREEAQQALAAIHQFLDETPENSLGLAQAAHAYDFTVGELLVWMKDLRSLLEKALETGGAVATVYS